MADEVPATQNGLDKANGDAADPLAGVAGGFERGPLSGGLAPGESATLMELHERERERQMPPPELEPLLESRPDWVRALAQKCVDKGKTEQFLNPLASRVAGEYLGSSHRWREALPFVRENLEVLAS